ncbi:carbohydrate kinase [Parathielavia hyrcaniae]|uniref:Gluconokinase n=1 Tax=Parathielavia hyrcaniae TaxID=113614 RepID=A0AAN6Q137_9PEZI|nr:carbohydrate kinase [Parathielavia hyrcaniae]
MSSGHSSIPPSPKAARLSATVLSHGIMTNGAASAHDSLARDQHIWLVTGPAGCGKSTVAKHLANSLQVPFIEGDEYHPQSNIDKMSAGIPLTDADRWDWLTALREASIQALDSSGDNKLCGGVVLTCSALKRKYRDVIRVAPYFTPRVHLHFIYLDAPEQVLLQRVSARQNHYMGANMVHSQLEVLEKPQADEVDVITVDVAREPDEVMADALSRVVQTMEEV